MKTSVLKYYYFFVLGISASVFGQNYSLSFDGDDDRVELPNQITEGLTSVTFMAWFNTTDHSGYSNIVQDDGPSGALFIRYNPDGSFKYVFKADQGWRSISISPPSYGVWHHVAMSWDGTNIKAYLDGEEVGNSNGSGTMSGGGPIYIGNWQQQEGFSGKIDDVQYWNIALSESEIQSHMNTELVGNEEGLIGYWNFNQGEGPELTDLSGNGYNGAIYGASWSGDGAPVESPVYGCTDINAENYNPDATADDGSCAGYPDNGNYSLSFDGEDDYVALPDIDLLGNYTLSMTYKPTSHDDYNSLFNKYPAYLEDPYEVVKRISDSWLNKDGRLIVGLDHYFENADSHSWQEKVGTRMLMLKELEWVEIFKMSGLNEVKSWRSNQHKDWEGTLVITGKK